MKKQHKIKGTRNGKEFTKDVTIEYLEMKMNGRLVIKPRIIKLFGHKGYIHYENIKDENGRFIRTIETPSGLIETYRQIKVIENFEIIK